MGGYVSIFSFLWKIFTHSLIASQECRQTSSILVPTSVVVPFLSARMLFCNVLLNIAWVALETKVPWRQQFWARSLTDSFAKLWKIIVNNKLKFGPQANIYQRKVEAAELSEKKQKNPTCAELSCTDSLLKTDQNSRQGFLLDLPCSSAIFPLECIEHGSVL